MRRSIILLAVVLCACGGPQKKRWDAKLTYLEQAQVDAARLPPPPAPGSDPDQADLAELRDWQARRTPAECARASSEAYARYDEFFAKLSPFAKPTPAAVSTFFENAGTDVALAVRVVKNRYKRPRPFRRGTGIKTCPGMEDTGGKSYPSGHAAVSRVYALMLCDIEPGRCDEFKARADEAALDRVIAGVHHPSDIEQGKRLADEFYEKLKARPAFAADLDYLRRNAVR